MTSLPVDTSGVVSRPSLVGAMPKPVVRKDHSGIGKLVILVVILGVWEAIVRGFKVPEILVPTPTSILEALWQGFNVPYSSPLALHEPTLMTMYKALFGLTTGSVLGLALAMALSRFRVVETYAMTYIMAFQSMPKVAIAPLLIVWCGFGPTSTIVLVTASCFFPVLVSDRKSTRLNSSHIPLSRMPSSA